MYHINAVDEVTQWEVFGATEQISEAYLQPVLKVILGQSPFKIRGFHSDNGSEFINHTVAELLGSTRGQLTNQRVYNFRVADHPGVAGNHRPAGRIKDRNKTERESRSSSRRDGNVV